jgi:hypothetical protein
MKGRARWVLAHRTILRAVSAARRRTAAAPAVVIDVTSASVLAFSAAVADCMMKRRVRVGLRGWSLASVLASVGRAGVVGCGGRVALVELGYQDL